VHTLCNIACRANQQQTQHTLNQVYVCFELKRYLGEFSGFVKKIFPTILQAQVDILKDFLNAVIV